MSKLMDLTPEINTAYKETTRLLDNLMCDLCPVSVGSRRAVYSKLLAEFEGDYGIADPAEICKDIGLDLLGIGADWRHIFAYIRHFQLEDSDTRAGLLETVEAIENLGQLLTAYRGEGVEQ